MPLIFQSAPDCTDPAIHHVRRGDDINARFSLCQCLLYQDCSSLVIQDVAVFIQHAILTMTGVRIKRDIGQYA